MRAADDGDGRPPAPPRGVRGGGDEDSDTPTAVPPQQQARATDTATGEGRGLFPPLLCQWHFRWILCVMTVARRRDDSATRVAAVASELFVHAVPLLCCVASTMFSTGQPARVFKCLVTVIFATKSIRVGQKTRIFQTCSPL